MEVRFQAFSLIGLVLVLLTTQHYFAVRYAIDEDTYEPGDRWVILLSIALVLLGSGVIYFVFTAYLDPNEFIDVRVISCVNLKISVQKLTHIKFYSGFSCDNFWQLSIPFFYKLLIQNIWC